MKQWDVDAVRKEFPFFAADDLIYLDNSATSQRPGRVLDAERDYSAYSNANPFRGLYELSYRATEAYEEARRKVQGFIGAGSEKEIIFTRNASESLNLVAYSLSEAILKEGDRIICTVAEHHSNLLPWQQAAKRHGAEIVYLHPTKNGTFSPEELEKLLTDRTKIVALTHMSNVFGAVNDVKTLAGLAHQKGAYFVCDGAQSVPHIAINVQDLDVDFLAFSGHKMFAPFGIGVLYGKEEILDMMPPFLTGGEMIESVSLDEVIYAELPHKFEAGTVNACGAVALAEAIRCYEDWDIEAMGAWEAKLTERAFAGMTKLPFVHILGGERPEDHHGILTFTVDRVHPHDVSAVFADEGIAVRAGHHCAEPLHQYLGIPSTTRCSIMCYNTEREIDAFLEVLSEIPSLMGF